MDATDKSMELFMAIGELMTDQEFISANKDFYDRHCATFDANVDENKHEYNQIFEEFLKIQEEVIEGKLKEQFTEEQILGFYEGLESNLKAYEAKDKETVDFLYEMIEFDKFKARMCQSKAMSTQDMQVEASKLSGDQLMSSMSDINMQKELEYYDSLMAESVSSQEHGWKKRLDVKEWTDDLKMNVYSRKQKATKNDLFRMEIKFRNKKMAEMNEFFGKIPVEKFDMIAEEKIFDSKEHTDKGYTTLIRYRRTTAPLVQDRDSLCAIFVNIDQTGKMFTMAKSIEDERYPEVKNVIRMYAYESFKIYDTVEDGVPVAILVGFQEMDIKGYIPVSLLNMSAANNIFKFFQTTMKIMNKK